MWEVIDFILCEVASWLMLKEEVQGLFSKCIYEGLGHHSLNPYMLPLLSLIFKQPHVSFRCMYI